MPSDNKRSVSLEKLQTMAEELLKAVQDLHGTARVYYATCSTAAATQRKDVTISALTALQTGDVFYITFTNNQNYNGIPTLRINSLTAANIRRITGTDAGRYEWQSGETLMLVWNGTYFLIVDGGFATTTYYGLTKLSSSVTSTSEKLAATPKAVKTAYDQAVNGMADHQKEQYLMMDDIPGTTVTPTVDSGGDVTTLTHKDTSSNETVRTDTFTKTSTTVTEVRTLATGEVLTIVTNRSTHISTFTFS